MAVSVVQNFIPKYQIIMSSKIVDLFAFKKRRTLKRTCPICGKIFNAKIDIDDPSPKEGTFCSQDCYHKFIYMDLAARVKKQDVEDFIKSKEHLIEAAIFKMLDDSSRDFNLSVDDMKQNARIALFYFYARALRKNKNPLEYTNSYLLRTIQQSLRPTNTEIKRQQDQTEEAVFEERNQEVFTEYRTSAFNIDKYLDLTNIIRKIIELSKDNENVKLVLTRAFLTEGHLKEHADLFKKYYSEYLGLTDVDVYNRIKKGTEHIFYNDYKNIKSYVRLDNLKNKYRFNANAFETLTEEEFGKEVAGLLDYYAGICTCSVCGKRFKAKSGAQLGAKSPTCSIECKRAAVRLQKQKEREKKGLPVGMIERQCAICGKTFLTKANSVQHKNVYCSEECRHEAVLEQKRKQWARYQANKTDKQRKREAERKRQSYMKNREQLLRKQQERRERKKKEKLNNDI